MDKKVTPIDNLPIKKKAKIVAIHPGYHEGHHRGRGHHGGHHFYRRMCAMGIREGQIVEVISKQPFFGPLTLSVGKCKMTIGRGMAHKILVEEL